MKKGERRRKDDIKMDMQMAEEQNEEKSKRNLLSLAEKLIPGTDDISHCGRLDNCLDKETRLCDDIKNLCLKCYSEEELLGGMSFAFGKNNGIIIYRFGESDSYVKLIEAKGIDAIINNYEKDEILKEITKRTKVDRDDRKDAKEKEIIEAFKRINTDILVVRKNKNGHYSHLDEELIKIAKEKEKETGRKIKIIDRSEIRPNFFFMDGIKGKQNFDKIKREIDDIMDADKEIFFIICRNTEKKDEFVLAISSLQDDILQNNIEKDRWNKYFSEKFNLKKIDLNTIDKK